MADPKDITRYVYVILRNGLHKIGLSHDPQKRAKILADGSTVVAIAPFHGTLRLERLLHNKFISKRVGGEWFMLSSEDVPWIANMTAEQLSNLETETEDSVLRGPVPIDLTSRPHREQAVERFEILLPPPVAEAAKKAAKRDGMPLGTWGASLIAKASGVPYVPPARGRRPKTKPDTPQPKRGKK